MEIQGVRRYSRGFLWAGVSNDDGKFWRFRWLLLRKFQR